jgi:hypothetical protein
VVAYEIVDHDAEKVFAFGGSADLLPVLDTVCDVSLELVERGGDAEGRAGSIEENAVGIEDEDGEFEGGVNFAVGEAEKRNVVRLDGIADAVTAERAVHFVRQDVGGSGSVFGLSRRAGGKDGYLHDDLGGCG